MSRYKLTIEYDGTHFRGWQVQQNARTVQGRLQEVLAEVLETAEFELQGAGRTDAGVHALAQAAHLEARTRLPAEELRFRLNNLLPPEIHVRLLEPAAKHFHARHDAVSRSYLYQISRRRTAFGKRLVWWVRDPLDAAIMREALSLAAGFHDFSAFMDRRAEDVSGEVNIEETGLWERGGLLLIRVRGSHFLWKMVRRIVGVLVEIGTGRLPPEVMAGLLAGPASGPGAKLTPGTRATARPAAAADRAGNKPSRRSGVPSYPENLFDLPARLTAPPSGLFLERILYSGDSPGGPPEPVIRIEG